MVSKGEEVIKEFMRFKVRMEGSMNGHEFEIEGEGEGRPYEGTQTAKLKVTKGGPLPFAWDILSPQFMYGSKAYVKHPADIPDYKKLSFPEGFKWERVMNFEDGGLVTVTQDSSLQDGTLIYKVKMRGTNFPPDGPVMQKKTMGWEASTERLYPRDGVLKGEIHQALKLKDGGHYLVEFKTIYMAKKPVQLPGYYYVDTKLDITSHNEDYTIVEQYERSEGRHHLFLGHGTGSTGSGSSGTASSEDNNMAVIKEFMRFKVRMEGSMNGHEFEIEGEGEGRPYEGTQTAKLKVTKGGPLPFAWDILSPQFMYGSKAYVKHPADIPDYKKLSFPEGFKWERVMNFEDGGLVTVTQDSSLQDGTLIYKVKMRGTNFPPDGPVMQKKTMGWEASTERLYPRDGVLKGEIHQALKLKDGGHYLVEFKTIYMAKKPVQLPGYYYVDTKLDITSHNEDYTIVEQYERSEGRHGTKVYDPEQRKRMITGPQWWARCKQMNVLDSFINYYDSEKHAENAVIFLHGNATSSYLWRHVVPHIEPVARCIIPDLIGMGKSGKSGNGSYRLLDHYKYLTAWFELLNLPKKIIFVGHDWGAALAFHYAYEHQDRIKAIVHMESVVDVIESWDEWPDIEEDIALIKSEEGEKMVLENNFFVETVLPSKIMRKLEPEEFAAYLEPFKEKGEVRRPTLSWPREIPLVKGGKPDVVQIVRNYNAYLRASDDLPKLFIEGDPGFFSNAIVEGAKKFPNTEFVKVKGLHFLQEDAPDEMGKYIKSFVERVLKNEQ
nr:tdTomato-RLuc8-S257G [synthetic construct]